MAEQSCQRLLNSFASDYWTFVPVTIEELCLWMLKNRASEYWTILPATVAHNSELLGNRASDCWRIIPATVEELFQWLLKNYASYCWRIVPVAVDESCQRLLTVVPAVFFSLFLTYFGKILTSFRVNTSIIIDYFNSGPQLSKLQDYWLIIIFMFSINTFYQPL